MDDTFDLSLRTAVYRHFASTGQSPTLDAMREAIGATNEQVRDQWSGVLAIGEGAAVVAQLHSFLSHHESAADNARRAEAARFAARSP